MWHIQGRGEVCTGFWWGNLRERDHLEDPRLRWEDNIKMDLQEVEFWGMDWIDLAQDRDRWQMLVNAAMNLRLS
jgi:hypothetical protein